MTVDSTSRIASSYLLASASVIFVIVEDHVHVDLMDPATYGSIFAHRCGIAMFIAGVWAIAETVHFLLFAEPADCGIGNTSSASFMQ